MTQHKCLCFPFFKTVETRSEPELKDFSDLEQSSDAYHEPQLEQENFSETRDVGSLAAGFDDVSAATGAYTVPADVPELPGGPVSVKDVEVSEEVTEEGAWAIAVNEEVVPPEVFTGEGATYLDAVEPHDREILEEDAVAAQTAPDATFTKANEASTPKSVFSSIRQLFSPRSKEGKAEGEDSSAGKAGLLVAGLGGAGLGAAAVAAGTAATSTNDAVVGGLPATSGVADALSGASGLDGGAAHTIAGVSDATVDAGAELTNFAVPLDGATEVAPFYGVGAPVSSVESANGFAVPDEVLVVSDVPEVAFRDVDFSGPTTPSLGPVESSTANIDEVSGVPLAPESKPLAGDIGSGEVPRKSLAQSITGSIQQLFSGLSPKATGGAAAADGGVSPKAAGLFGPGAAGLGAGAAAATVAATSEPGAVELASEAASVSGPVDDGEIALGLAPVSEIEGTTELVDEVIVAPSAPPEVSEIAESQLVSPPDAVVAESVTATADANVAAPDIQPSTADVTAEGAAPGFAAGTVAAAGIAGGTAAVVGGAVLADADKSLPEKAASPPPAAAASPLAAAPVAADKTKAAAPAAKAGPTKFKLIQKSTGFMGGWNEREFSVEGNVLKKKKAQGYIDYIPIGEIVEIVPRKDKKPNCVEVKAAKKGGPRKSWCFSGDKAVIDSFVTALQSK